MSSEEPSAPVSKRELRIKDVDAEIEGLKHGAGFILLVSEGYLDQLEGYSYDEPWPKQIGQFEVRYQTGGERDLAALDL